jgi:hypothetical protein
MLLVDGIKYRLWTPRDEEKEFHPIIRGHYKEIFGEDSLYFDVKHVLKTTSGIGSIPDAYVINLSKPSEWYVVENELASHPVYDHIVKQLTKFINGIANQSARSQILDMLYDEINKDNVLKATVQKLIDSTDIYRALSKLLSNPPRIVIMIDQKTSEVEEACQVLKYQTDIVEFRTFLREDAENVHAHLFEPIYFVALQKVAREEPLIKVEKTELGEVKIGDILEIEIKTLAPRKYGVFYLPKNRRRFFPGYKLDFILETDVGEIKTRVTGAKAGTPGGDPDGGAYVQGGLREWYDKHQELTLGAKVRFECIEPYRRYKLFVV